MTAHIGLHVVQTADHDRLKGLVTRLAMAGTPVPILTFVNHPEWCDEFKLLSPNTIIINRIETNTDPLGTDDGGQWLHDRLPFVLRSKLADYHQVACEALSTVPVMLSNFYVSMMHYAHAMAIPIIVGNIASGNPPGDIQLGIQAMTPMLSLARDLKFPVGYHNYSPANDQVSADVTFEADYYALRYKAWQAAFPGLIIICNESGTGNPAFQGVEKTMRLMKQMNSIVDVPCAWWTWGAWENDGGASRIDEIELQYEAWRKSMGGQPIPSVPTPPTLGEAEFVAYSTGHKPDEPVLVRFVTPNTPEFMFPLNVIIRGEDDVPPAPLLPPTPEAWTVAVTTPVLNIRADHSLNSAIVGKYHQQTVIAVLAVDDATLKADNNYVQVVGQPGHWVAYQYLAQTALKPTA